MENAQLLLDKNAQLREELKRLRKSQGELTDFFENGSVGLHCVDGEGIIQRANSAELEMLGYSSEEYVGHHIYEFHRDADVSHDIMRRLSTGETLRDVDARMVSRDGSIRDVKINSSALFEDDKFVHTRCFTRDVTQSKRTEAAMLRAQKLESLGVMASGIAHDFNNLLVGILGNAEFAFRLTKPSEKFGRISSGYWRRGGDAGNFARRC